MRTFGGGLRVQAQSARSARRTPHPTAPRRRSRDDPPTERERKTERDARILTATADRCDSREKALSSWVPAHGRGRIHGHERSVQRSAARSTLESTSGTGGLPFRLT